MENAVETRNLTRIFKKKPKRGKLLTVRKKEEKAEMEDKGPVVALNSVNLQIKEGELFGLLGPNGAGKTTLLKILATLLLPTSGEAYVAGYDVTKDPFPIRSKINMVSGGETSGYGLLTTRENIWMFSQFYGIPSKTAKKRIDELLKTFGLWEKRDAKVRTLSSGQKQKMGMVRGFVTDPEIIFLDEPTLGLDVNASRVIRDYIKDWVRKGNNKTVLLTTHYMMEAEEMCDRIAIIDRGKILACDTPENLKKLIKKSSTFKLEVDILRDVSAFKKVQGIRNFSYSENAPMNRANLTFIIEEESAVSDIVSEIMGQGSRIHSLQKIEPTLEDVFISLCGRGLE